jgi:2-(1,2-epoxy-1,2-dihydrophenyl)acetyl-CoA isomerase
MADSTVTDDGAVTTSRDGDVLRVTLDRPSRRNSLNQPMIEAFVDALTAAATDDSLRAIHIHGAGSDFCAGADWVATNTGERPRTGDLVRRIPTVPIASSNSSTASICLSSAASAAGPPDWAAI